MDQTLHPPTFPPCVLTIAGSDSGGGAGIQADLKSIMMQGCYGLSVVTALTAQNTRGVTAIEAPTPGFVAEQLRVVRDDFPIRAAKTGMLFSAPIIEAVADGLVERDFPLVVDPVSISQSGANLLEPAAVQTLIDRLLPLADLVTPNRPEAEMITGLAIKDEDDLSRVFDRFWELGLKAVLLKGGHFATSCLGEGVISDWLATADGRVLTLARPRIDTHNTHGTGCTLSAAIAAQLALGRSLFNAVAVARAYLQATLEYAYDLGGGDGPVNHLAPYQAALKKLQNSCTESCPAR